MVFSNFSVLLVFPAGIFVYIYSCRRWPSQSNLSEDLACKDPILERSWTLLRVDVVVVAAPPSGLLEDFLG